MALPDDPGPDVYEDPALDRDLADLARVLDALPGFAPRFPRLPYPRRMRAAWRWWRWMSLLDTLPVRMAYAPPTPAQRAAYDRLVARARERHAADGGAELRGAGVGAGRGDYS